MQATHTSTAHHRAVNLLFLIVLLLQAANLLLLWLPQYVRLILNELCFVFLPAYLYLRLTRQPIRQRVRWTWPGWRIAGLSLLIGMALYPLSALGGSVLQQLLGDTHLALPADVIPTTALMGILALVAYAVMAPLCEEFLFRGVLQPVYESRGARWAVLFVGLLFVIFHLSLLQSVNILPLALVLGFVNYRVRSLPASILTHFGANVLAALVLTGAVFNTGARELLFSTPVLIGSPVVALVALAVFIRLTRRQPQPPPAPQLRERPLRLAASWPLLVAAVLYLAVVGVELHTARTPQPVADPLRLNAAVWEGAWSGRYDIRNAADELVGSGECRWNAEGALVELTCTSAVIAYEVRIGNSYWSSAGGERQDRFRWRADDGRLVDGRTALDLRGGEYRAAIEWAVGEDGIAVEIRTTDAPDRSLLLSWAETPLADTADLPILTDYAVPWQLAAMRLTPGEQGQAVRFHPFTWRQATQDSGPVTAQWLVSVAGREQISTPAGAFDALKVTFGDHQTVWFDDSRTPALPVQFFNGVETWSLK